MADTFQGLRDASSGNDALEFDCGRSGVYLVGRGLHCDLVIADDRASRRHCVVVSSPPRSYVRDLGSTNGTLVNGTPIHRPDGVPGGYVRLMSGDTLGVGDREFTIMCQHSARSTQRLESLVQEACTDGADAFATEMLSRGKGRAS